MYIHAREADLIPGSGRYPGGGHGNPLQYSCLENLLNRGAWWATIHRVSKSWPRLSEWALKEGNSKCSNHKENLFSTF